MRFSFGFDVDQRIRDVIRDPPETAWVVVLIAVFDMTIFIGPVIGVVGIAVSVYLWKRSRARKALSYRVEASAMVSVHRDVDCRIKILYDDRPVADVRLLSLHVENSGNADITAADFAEPLTLALGDNAQVLTPPTTGKRSPGELEPIIEVVAGSSLVVAPLLLNAGDSFEVAAIVSGLDTGNEPRARITGVRTLTDAAVKRASRPWRAEWWLSMEGFVFFMVSLAAMLVFVAAGQIVRLLASSCG